MENQTQWTSMMEMMKEGFAEALLVSIYLFIYLSGEEILGKGKEDSYPDLF